MFFSCPASEQLAQALVDSTSGRMSRAFIVSSGMVPRHYPPAPSLKRHVGSEATEAAIKLARQYFLEVSPPQPQRVRFIARHESYHGNTVGALGISGHKGRRLPYEPILSPNVSHVSACNAYRGKHAGETDESYVARLAGELDEEFQRVGPETVCAFVAEPVVGAALGCTPPVPGYFKAIKAVCDKYGALLILDEIMCGMGRMGTMHAWEQEGIVPDIQSIGKGLGGGYVPVAGLLIGHRVVDALDKGTGVFVHGQTYQSHAMVCAGALTVLNIVQSDGLIGNVKAQGVLLETLLREGLENHPYVGNIRGRGLFWGVEFVRDKNTKEPFEPSWGVAAAIYEEGVRQTPGVMLYPGTGSVDGKRGDHILLAPPYNITADEIRLIVDASVKAIENALSKIYHKHLLQN